MYFKLFLLVSLSFFFLSCGGNTTPDEIVEDNNVIQKNSRIFEIDITQPQTQDYTRDIALVKSIGAESISVSLDWTVIEVDYNTTSNTPIYASGNADLLQIVNDYYSYENLQVTLSLRPVITLVRNTPPDLNTSDLNSTAVIDRFKLLLDHVIAKLPDVELTSLVIGSEVNLYLQTSALKAQYLDFYEQVSSYARDKYSSTYPSKDALNISVETTYEGLTGTDKDYYINLNAFSDVIGVSYYPVSGTTVSEPSEVAGELRALIDLYPSKELYFYQLGYPSGYFSSTYYEELATQTSTINTSETKQAEFIDAVFVAWDEYEDNIKLIDFTWLHDLSNADVIAATSNPAFGGTSTPAPEFAEFLRTLGLRTYDNNGTDKEAFRRLKENTAARGW